jgi:hypothetical protein
MTTTTDPTMPNLTRWLECAERSVRAGQFDRASRDLSRALSIANKLKRPDIAGRVLAAGNACRRVKPVQRRPLTALVPDCDDPTVPPLHVPSNADAPHTRNL